MEPTTHAVSWDVKKNLPIWLYHTSNNLNLALAKMWRQKLKSDLEYWAMAFDEVRPYGSDELIERTIKSKMANTKWLNDLETVIDHENLEEKLAAIQLPEGGE